MAAMRTLTIRLVIDGDEEDDSYVFFNETLSPLLEHVECDVYIEDERGATAAEIDNRNGENEL